MLPCSGVGQSVHKHRVTCAVSAASGSSGLAWEAAYAVESGCVGPRCANDGELGTSPEVSEEREPEGEGGACMVSSPSPGPVVVEIGVAWSYAEAPVRRRFEGGMGKGVEAEGESVAEMVSSRE